MRGLYVSRHKLALAELPLMFTINSAQYRLGDRDALAPLCAVRFGDFSGPLEDLCIEFRRNIRREKTSKKEQLNRGIRPANHRELSR